MHTIARDFSQHDWLRITCGLTLKINRLDTLKPEQLIVVASLVTGLSASEKNQYSYSVNFYVLDPTQKPIFGQRDYAKGKGTLPNKPMHFMADPALDIILEASDPEGMYTIVAQVTDLVSGNKADNIYKISYIK